MPASHRHTIEEKAKKEKKNTPTAGIVQQIQHEYFVHASAHPAATHRISRQKKGCGLVNSNISDPSKPNLNTS
jgi:hypothetical protein